MTMYARDELVGEDPRRPGLAKSSAMSARCGGYLGRLADLAGATIKGVGVLEYERRCPLRTSSGRWLMYRG
jgi:hypothetical protein